MSITYDSHTFFDASATKPMSFGSLEELQAITSRVWSEAAPETRSGYLSHRQDPQTLTLVTGCTRNGWAVSTLSELLADARFPVLGFLTLSGHQQLLTGAYQETRVSLLEGDLQTRAIAELRQFIEHLAEHPEDAAAASGEVFGEEDVLEAADEDIYSADPAHDSSVEGEDGEGAHYLFVYLRSVLAVLENSQRCGQPTVHALHCPM